MNLFTKYTITSLSTDYPFSPERDSFRNGHLHNSSPCILPHTILEAETVLFHHLPVAQRFSKTHRHSLPHNLLCSQNSLQGTIMWITGDFSSETMKPEDNGAVALKCSKKRRQPTVPCANKEWKQNRTSSGKEKLREFIASSPALSQTQGDQSRKRGRIVCKRKARAAKRTPDNWTSGQEPLRKKPRDIVCEKGRFTKTEPS